VFLHNWVNAMWNFEEQKALFLLSLLLFSIKKSQLHYKGCKHLRS
jgi:hypothetical protein